MVLYECTDIQSSCVRGVAVTLVIFCGVFSKVVNSERIERAATPRDVISGGHLDFISEILRFKAEELPDATFIAEKTYDFIVVGAGTAGATIASRLSEIPDVTILLIEAGGSESRLMGIPLGASLLQFDKKLNWQYKTEPSDSYCLGMKNHQCRWPRGRVMGGSSTINFMIATRGNKRDYDEWASMGNYGWSWEEVLPYFKKLEGMNIDEYKNDTKYHNVHGPLNIERVPYHTPIAEAFVEAGLELGWNKVDYNSETQTGFSMVQSNMKNGMRLSSNAAYLHPVRDRENLFVTKKSLATKIIIRDKRAIGVEIIKSLRRKRVWARKEVIVCAGAINSPQLLMLSGIGPRKDLERLGIDVLVDAPVGENLMDHIAFGGLIFTVDQPVAIRHQDILNLKNPSISEYLANRQSAVSVPGTTEALAFVNVDDPRNDYPNVELFFASASVATGHIFKENLGLERTFFDKSFSNITSCYSWSIFPMLMRPKSRGKIVLRNDNPFDHPRIIANYMSHRDDVRVLIKAVRSAIRVGNTNAMRKYGSRLHRTPISGCERFQYNSDDYWECAIRMLTMNIYHYSGTCKMGPRNDPTAVVDPTLKVQGIRNLRVADASIMPTIPTAHTNIPTHMIAEKSADMVKRDWGYRTDPLT